MLLNELPDIIDRDKFNNALRNITVMERKGNMVIYHCDIYSAIRCGIEKRNLKESEWD